MLEPGEHLLKGIVGILLSVLLLSWLLKRFRQPYFSAYITDVTTIAQIGSLGLIMQMFFIGAEIEVPALMKNIRTSVVGTFVQLGLSFVFIAAVGAMFAGKWPSRNQLAGLSSNQFLGALSDCAGSGQFCSPFYTRF